MAKIVLTGDTKLTDEIIEALKPFAAEEDGQLTLDTEQLKTATELNKVYRSKQNADNELKTTKQSLTDALEKLKKWTESFADGNPDDLKTELETYRKGKGDMQSELIRATQLGKEWERKFNDLKKETDPMRERVKQADARDYSDKQDAIWAEKRKGLDPKWSKRKADVLFRSAKNLIKIAENDPNDFDKMPTGQTFEDWMDEQLDLIDGYETIQGGRGNPGKGNPQNANQPKGMFDQAASQIHFQ